MSIGIWQIIIIPSILLLLFGIPFLATYSENSGRRIGRGQFALWLLSILILSSFSSLADDLKFILCLFILGLAWTFLFQQALVRRVRDSGNSKSLAYIAIIPLVNIFIYI
jgi:hypothetical protein